MGSISVSWKTVGVLLVVFFGVIVTEGGLGVIFSNVWVDVNQFIRDGLRQALGLWFFCTLSGCLIVVLFTKSEISVAPQEVREIFGITWKPSLSRFSRRSSSRSNKVFSTFYFAFFAYFLVVSISHLPVVLVLFVGMTILILGCSSSLGRIK